MAKFNDSEGKILIDSSVVIEELRKIISPIAELQVDEIVETMDGANPYEYSITFPVTFSNFDYEKMAEYGFTDDKLREELSKNIAKNLYDGVMAIILNGESSATDDLINNGYALNYSINKDSDMLFDEDRVTNIKVEDDSVQAAVDDIIKYHLDTFRKLFGGNPKQAMCLGLQEHTQRALGLDPSEKNEESTDVVVDEVPLSIKAYEVHRNDNGVIYLSSKENVIPFILRVYDNDETDEFRIAVYKKLTTNVLYCKLYE